MAKRVSRAHRSNALSCLWDLNPDAFRKTRWTTAVHRPGSVTKRRNPSWSSAATTVRSTHRDKSSGPTRRHAMHACADPTLTTQRASRTTSIAANWTVASSSATWIVFAEVVFPCTLAISHAVPLNTVAVSGFDFFKKNWSIYEFVCHSYEQRKILTRWCHPRDALRSWKPTPKWCALSPSWRCSVSNCWTVRTSVSSVLARIRRWSSVVVTRSAN